MWFKTQSVQKKWYSLRLHLTAVPATYFPSLKTPDVSFVSFQRFLYYYHYLFSFTQMGACYVHCSGLCFFT